MTEVPEHLLAKAKAAREKAAAKKAAEAPAEEAGGGTAVAVAEEEEEAPQVDERREELLAMLSDELGDALVASHIIVGSEVMLRIRNEDWREAVRTVKGAAQCQFFDFLSAIDWMPSPYGREMDAEVDTIVHGAEEAGEEETMEQGLTGGDTRFQVFTRIQSVTRHHSVILKADVADDDPRIDTIVPVYPGANWHEREAWEMYGIGFNGHPDVRHLYLPTEFEGHPLRKDFPLLTRRMKPWPGIVDVEQMPGEGD